MKALPAVIAVVAVVTAFRLGRRRRAAGRPSPARIVAARLGGRVLFGDTGLVAAREIRERVRGRVFRVVTVVLFAAVAAAVVIPTIHGRSAGAHRVAVVDGSPALEAQLQSLGRNVGLAVDLVNEPDLASARAALSAGHADMVVDGAGTIVVANPVSATDSSAAARYVQAVSVTLGAQRAFARAGLTPQQAAAVAAARPLPVQSLHPGKKARTTAEATALLGVILIFIVLTQYLTWTLMGVME